MKGVILDELSCIHKNVVYTITTYQTIDTTFRHLCFYCDGSKDTFCCKNTSYKWEWIWRKMFLERKTYKRLIDSEWYVVGYNGKPQRTKFVEPIYYWGLLPSHLFEWILKNYLSV